MSVSPTIAAPTSFVVGTDGQLTATAPAESGAVPVTVTTAGGTSTVAPTAAYTYFSLRQVIATAPPGSAGTVLVRATTPGGISAVVGYTDLAAPGS